MASTSSSITPSYWKYDVFLSFRGKDTRNNFTSHLYDALRRNQIDAYIDYKLRGGEKIEPALLERIEESYISVVIFSENYADSTFCLRELSKILECMETKGQMVLPVFHQLDPSHVQDLTGSYGDALRKHDNECSSEEVESWRRASKEIANLKGWDSNVIKDESVLIQEILSDIQKKLRDMPSPSVDSKRLIGIQSRVEDIESLLSFGSTGVLIVGIWGMGGIGKTTTAESVYHRNFRKFEGHCFFRNVREESNKHGPLHVLQEILREVLEKKDLNIRTKELTSEIKRMLQRKKVLIVLDDVDSPRELKDLVGEDGSFGQGSRIIVTSRDRQVLINSCEEDKIYEVENLDDGDALELFSLHAFKQINPIEKYTKLSKSMVSCVTGIPLVLEVLGASLYKKNEEDYWENKLAQLRKNGSEDIIKHLEMCYHELDRAAKKIFLDIACFFGNDVQKDLVKQTLDLEERNGIDRLTDMCLIKIVDNKIWIHDVLQKLGREIVHQENVDPRKRSRLWEAEDVKSVLKNRKGTGKVETIFLDFSATEEMDLSPKVFKKMHNLRLLNFYRSPFYYERARIHLPQGLQFLSNNLRFLHWYDYPLKSLTTNFCPKKLVHLGMPFSQLEQLWNEYQPLENLKLMNLIASRNLSLINSDLSEVPNLEVLNLAGCNSLVEVPSSIEYCTKLTELELRECVSLRTLPSSIGCLSQLFKLNLTCCKRLTGLPDSIGGLKSLVELYLDFCSELASLPDSIGGLKSLVKLNLYSCSKLASLPNSIGKLKSLVELNLDFCSKLASLPDNFCELKSLLELNLCCCFKIASLPNSIGKLKCLVKVNLEGCSKLSSLPDSICELKSLEELDLNACEMLESLPNSIGELKCLAKLDLESCSKLASLPNGIYDLESLEWLNVEDCSKLNGFPVLNRSCSEGGEIASSTNKLGCLQFLNLDHSGVLEIPDSLGSLVSLTELRLTSNDFETIPANIKQLSKLIKLVLYRCKRLRRLPELPSSLQVLMVPDCISLESVANLFIQGEEEYEVASQEFNFANCLKLDQNSCIRIMGDARLRIQCMATSLFNQKYFGEPIGVRVCMPGSEVPEWFRYKNTEGSLVEIKLPAHWHCTTSTDQFLGFTFCAVVSFFPCDFDRDFDISCECHLITEGGIQSDLIFYYFCCGIHTDLRFYKFEGDEEEVSSTSEINDHMFIWSINSNCFFKEASFHFHPHAFTVGEVVKCGVHPLFVQDYIDMPEQPRPKKMKVDVYKEV